MDENKTVQVNNPEVNMPNPGMNMQNPGMNMQNPGMNMQNSGMNMQNPGMNMQNPGMNMQNPGINMQNPGINMQNPGMNMQNPGMNMQNPGMNMQNPGMNMQNPGMQYNGVPAQPVYPSDLQMSLQNKNTETKKKSHTPVIITVTALLTALLVAGIVLIFHKPKPDKEKTTEQETATEVVTTEVASTTEEKPDTTEEKPDTTEVAQQPSVPGYEAPTALGTSWKDYNFSLGGTIYQLPIPYTAFTQFGWEMDAPPEKVSAGSFEYVLAEAPDGTECSLIVGNAGISAAPLEECYILGIDIDTEYDELESEMILPGDIVVGQSTIQDVKAKYGTPDDYFAYDDGSEVTYVGDNFDDGLDMDFTADGTLRGVKYIRAEVAGALEQNASNVSQDVPAMNAKYVKPSGPSKSEDDGILEIDGEYYKLPVPLSEFLAAGWELDIMSEEIIYGNNSISTYITKGDAKLEVNIYNYTEDAILTVNGIVSYVSVYDYFVGDMKIVFPGNIMLGDTSDDVKAVYEKYGDDFYDSEVGDFATYSAYMTISEEDFTEYEATFGMEKHKVTDMQYSIYGFTDY